MSLAYGLRIYGWAFIRQNPQSLSLEHTTAARRSYLDAAVVRRLETLGFRIRLAVSLSSPVTARQMNPESVSTDRIFQSCLDTSLKGLEDSSVDTVHGPSVLKFSS
jgi:hypothetical protein